jgi:hypothetical protein
MWVRSLWYRIEMVIPYFQVDRHVRRLDDDLQRFEDEQMTGPGRIVPAAQPVNSLPEIPRKNGQKEKDKKESRDKRNQQSKYMLIMIKLTLALRYADFLYCWQHKNSRIRVCLYFFS